MSDTNKYAIVKSGHQQFKVSVGDLIKVNKLPGNKGEQVILEQVLAVSENETTRVGTPTLSGATVSAKIVAQTKGAKVIAFKKKRRKGFNWKRGHRQQLTELQIESIN